MKPTVAEQGGLAGTKSAFFRTARWWSRYYQKRRRQAQRRALRRQFGDDDDFTNAEIERVIANAEASGDVVWPEQDEVE